MHPLKAPLLALLLITTLSGFAQQRVFTEDIDRFWIAYDSAGTTTDSIKQVDIIQSLYLDKATPGLKAFAKARNYNAPLYVKLIRHYPRFWASIRPNTLQVKSQTEKIEKAIDQLKTLYPSLKDSKMYFTIGGLRSGGTTTDHMVLIGAEIATGNPTTDVSEFSSKWLAGVFAAATPDNLVQLNIHEYVHTQQHGESENLLAQTIKEGSCDFISELATKQPLHSPYQAYGKEHRDELKEAFKQDMFTTAMSRWLYQGNDAKPVADLGYFIGYDICQFYYKHASNKTQAIKDIIELNYSDTTAVETFLQHSGYYKEPIDKQALVQAAALRQPRLTSVLPIHEGDSAISADTKELTFVFSNPMGNNYSINYGPKGKTAYPITTVRPSATDKTQTIAVVALEPNHEYQFVISNRSFSSAEGYPLDHDYLIQFKTKP